MQRHARAPPLRLHDVGLVAACGGSAGNAADAFA
jgi:hypothetical protein